jgi:Predicted membrane protein
MIDWTWIRVAEDAPLMIVLSAVALYLLLILYARLVGLRSFSKMSGFDFAITISIGSILTSVTLWQKPTLLEGAVALGVLFGLQFVVGNLRKRLPDVTRLVDNRPLLLTDGPEVLSDNLRRANMTDADLRAKLREANVPRLEQVRAIVMESTGDVSVLHAPPEASPIDDALLRDVHEGSR